MKRLFTFLIIIFLINSCKKEKLSEPVISKIESQVRFQGLEFDSWDDFYETYNLLSKSNSEDYLMNWIYDNNPNSLYLNSSDDDWLLKKMEGLTPGFLVIMNGDFEFKVGGFTIVYENEIFYEAHSVASSNSIVDKAGRFLNKIGFMETKIIGYINDSGKLISNSELPSNERIAMGVNATSSAVWKDFSRIGYYECGTNRRILGKSSRKMRYFHQLASKTFAVGRPNARTAELFIQFKLYYRDRRNRFKYATKEQRNYQFNLRGTIGFGGNFIFGNPANVSLNLNEDKRCIRTSRWWNHRIQTVEYIEGLGYDPSWFIQATGTITHSINGDSYNSRWVANVNW